LSETRGLNKGEFYQDEPDWWREEWLRGISNDIGRQYDSVIIVDGRPGAGKSWLAMVICNELAAMAGHRFWASNMAFSEKQMRHLSLTLPKGAPILWDEMHDGAFGRDAMSKENKAAVRFGWVMRVQFHPVVGCTPSFYGIDRFWREERAVFRVALQARGLANVYRAAPTEWGREVWWKKIGVIDLREAGLPEGFGELVKAYQFAKEAAVHEAGGLGERGRGDGRRYEGLAGEYEPDVDECERLLALARSLRDRAAEDVPVLLSDEDALARLAKRSGANKVAIRREIERPR